MSVTKTRPHPTAFISVFSKEGIVDFARALSEMGWPLMSSSGTATALKAAGLEVADIADKVGKPIFEHRVATLSRELYAGVLARNTEEDLAVLDEIGFPRIGLVCVDMYPLQTEVLLTGATLASVIARTDIGGPSLVRAAAKSRLVVVCDPADRMDVLAWLKQGRPSEAEYLGKLAAKAEFVVAQYVMTSATYLSGGFYQASFSQDDSPVTNGGICLPRMPAMP